jgi:high-affinity nickel permease
MLISDTMGFPNAGGIEEVTVVKPMQEKKNLLATCLFSSYGHSTVHVLFIKLCCLVLSTYFCSSSLSRDFNPSKR